MLPFQGKGSRLVVKVCHLILPIVAIGAILAEFMAVLDDEGQVLRGVA